MAAISEEALHTIIRLLQEEAVPDATLLGPIQAPSVAPALPPSALPPLPQQTLGQGNATVDPVVTPVHGPGGSAVDVLLCLFPLIFLVVVTLVKWIQLPTKISLPVAAVFMWCIRLMYFAAPPNYVTALVVSGFFEALTPLSIIFGAILLFQTMHHTKCLPWMMSQIKSLSGGHPVAEVFLIAWSFAYLVEGASGFGTPVALASPMLAELGHDPIRTITCCLITNSLATQFGAVGTPIWFGFSSLGLSQSDFQQIGLQTAMIVGVTAYVIPILAAMLLVRPRDIMRNIMFVLLSITTAVAPSVGIAFFSYEFPTLIGGMISLFLTGLLIRFKIGLRPTQHMTFPDTPLAAGDDKEGQEEDEKAGDENAGEEDDDAAGDALLGEGTEGSVAGGKGVKSGKSASGKSVKSGGFLSSVRQGLSKSMAMGKPKKQGPTQGGDGGGVMHGNNLQLVEGVGLVSMPPTANLNFPLNLERSPAVTTDAAVGCDMEEQGDKADVEGGGPAGTKGVVKFHPHMRESSRSSSKQLIAADVESTVVEEDVEDDETNDLYLDDVLNKTAAPTADGDMEVSPLDPNVAVKSSFKILTAIGRLMPIWLTVVVLLITRIPQLKIKGVLQSTSDSVCLTLGSFGKFCINPSIVMQLRGILKEPTVNWKYEFLYVPFFLPFVVVSSITIAFYWRSYEKGVRLVEPFREAGQRLAGAIIPTLGALVLVQLIRQGGMSSPAMVIGYWLSEWLGVFFILLSAALGALGSFFSGSTTVSNLTFGDIQLVAALTINKPVPTMLAIQTAGAALGNMICINNIISAKAVMNLNHVSEGTFIAKTGPVAVLMAVIATGVGYLFTILF